MKSKTVAKRYAGVRKRIAHECAHCMKYDKVSRKKAYNDACTNQFFALAVFLENANNPFCHSHAQEEAPLFKSLFNLLTGRFESGCYSEECAKDVLHALRIIHTAYPEHLTFVTNALKARQCDYYAAKGTGFQKVDDNRCCFYLDNAATPETAIAELLTLLPYEYDNLTSILDACLDF